MKRKLLMVLLSVGVAGVAEAQYSNPYTPRGVAQFSEGQEEHGMLHWHTDLDVLREWQQEYAYWLADYNWCAKLAGFGDYFWPENPTLRRYDVSRGIVQEEFAAGKYSRLIDAINQHIASGHETEDQFADAVYQLHINGCHCRQSIRADVCDSGYVKRRPYRYVKHVIESNKGK